MALSVPRFLPTKTYLGQDVRHTLAATGVQAGVLALSGATEFQVTQDTGANMNSKVAQADSGAWIFGTDTTRQGAYHVYNDAAVTLTHTSANATNPRVDQVVLRVYDSSVIGGGTDAAQLEVIAGTPTSGATLANRSGAVDLTTIAAPKSMIRLADVLIPAASTAVTTANIRDRRLWARGALATQIGSGANLTVVPASTWTDASTQIPAFSLEVGANPIGGVLGCSFQTLSASQVGVRALIDGSAAFGSWGFVENIPTGVSQITIPLAPGLVTAGRHTFSVQVWSTVANPTFFGSGFFLSIEERVRQLATN